MSARLRRDAAGARLRPAAPSQRRSRRSRALSPLRASRATRSVLFALALLVSSAPLLLAQSGRRSAPAPAELQSGKKVAAQASPTPTPAPVWRVQGPIAEPTSADADAGARKKDSGLRPGDTSAGGAQSGKPKDSAADPDAGEEVVRISANLVPLPASVVDAQGRAVADLKAEDFELKVDGEVKPIGDLSRSETPVSIALLFDNSSSLNAMREFERQAAVRFIRSVVRPVDRAAVFSISTEPELSRALTNDVRALVRTVEGFAKPEAAATALFDTVTMAADYLKPQRTRKVIVIISDGTDTVSNLDFDTTMARLLADDCQVYAVQTGNSESPNLHDLAGARRLQEFAAQTGGAVYVPHDNAELAAAFSQIATDLSQQYVLSYYPSGELRDGRFRTFTLNVKTRPGLRVRTRKGYYSPKG